MSHLLEGKTREKTHDIMTVPNLKSYRSWCLAVELCIPHCLHLKAMSAMPKAAGNLLPEWLLKG